jgi:RNA polymerase sigma-70 factor (sigma-E family)
MEQFRVVEGIAESEEARRPADRLEDAYVRNAPAALRLAYFLTGDRDSAQDLLQDAFVRVCARMRLHAVDDLDAYLRRTMVNLFTSALRRRKVERAWLARERASAIAATSDHDPAERDEMWRALQTLPVRQRAAVVLRFYEDLSEHEAAHVLGCSTRALNSLITRALQGLRAGRSEVQEGEET